MDNNNTNAFDLTSTVVFEDQSDAQYFGVEGNALYNVVDTREGEWCQVLRLQMVTEAGDAEPMFWASCELFKRY